MKRILNALIFSAGLLIRLAFVGVILAIHFVMDMVGLLICAISSEN